MKLPEYITAEARVPGSAWIVWAVPLGIGLVGAIVAPVYQKLAVILVGFNGTGQCRRQDCIHYFSRYRDDQSGFLFPENEPEEPLILILYEHAYSFIFNGSNLVIKSTCNIIE
ncbi:hypothetical protein [Desulfobacula sp.]|uniref:hypothetical protein n=1 Tax=Desulfobacula sp. TaxID=2593537 RepID=UPI0026387AB8|nr:hypothetical protein [Desulfobacula sp.]